jgi:CHASE3 domain sensor protein
MAAILVGLTLMLLIVAVTRQRDSARVAFRSQEALAVGSQLENAVISIENGLRGYVASGEPRLLQPVNDAIRRYQGQQRTLARLVSQEGGQRERVARIGGMIDDYVGLWARPVIDLAGDDLKRAQAQLLTNDTSTRPDETLNSRLDPVRSEFVRLFRRERAVIAERQSAAEQRSSRAITFGIGGLAVAVAVAVGFTLYLRRSIVRPVLTVADATGRLAAGDLTTRVPAEREDELGDLAHGFNAMADSLARGRAELERSNTELKRSNAELEQFASVTSHDLQAPRGRARGRSRSRRRHPRRHATGPGADPRPARVLARGPRPARPRGGSRGDRHRGGAGAAGRGDRAQPRADRRRAAAGRARRSWEPVSRLPEPRGQRGEIHSGEPATGSHRGRARQRTVALLGA